MNAQKFTQKSLEAIQDANALYNEYGNAEMGQEHLLLALLHQDGGLIAQLMTKMGIDPNNLERQTRQWKSCRVYPADAMPAACTSPRICKKP